MENFESFGLQDKLMQSLKAMNFNAPTPIQAQTIPHALLGKDVLGTAQTGTGKTAAFGIPVVSHLLNNRDDTALILTPTRELAQQVLKALQQMLGRQSPIKSALLIGGDPIFKQFKQLSSHPRLVVGTPGRVNDHLERQSLSLEKAHFLVLDETDRMLDMGFSVQIQRILKHMPAKRQTLMFSATMAPNIVKLTHQYLNEPVRITVGSTTTPVAKIKQQNIRVNAADKYSTLLEKLENQSDTTVIFVQTKWGTEKLAEQLRKQKLPAEAIHGDLRQRQRERIIQQFRQGKFSILVATDVAARGLDIPHITRVINYDLPQCPEDYIHRIGRTGRAGSEGTAINLIAPQDSGKWRDIERLMDPNQKQHSGTRGSRDSFQRRKPALGAKRHGAEDGRRPKFGAPKRRTHDSDGKPSFGSKRRFDEDDKPNFGSKRRRFDGDDKPSFGGPKRRRFDGDDKPSFGGPKRRRFDGDDKPAFGSGRRSHDGDDKPTFGGPKRRSHDGDDKPAFGQKRRSRNQDGNPPFGAPKRRYTPNKTKPAFGAGKKRFSAEKG